MEALIYCRGPYYEGVVAQCCNPLILQPESGGGGSKPGRAPSLERHDMGSWTRLALGNPSAWR